MTLYVLGSIILALVTGAGWIWWRSYRSGRKTERLVSLSRGLNGLDKAMDARDRVRSDAEHRERLRDKYRAG